MQKNKPSSKNQKNSPDKKNDAPTNLGITGKEHEQANRMVSFRIRTITTLAMLGAMILILSLGHSYTAGAVIFLMFMCFKELKELKRKREQENNIPWFNLINWYFFVCTL